MLKLIYLYICDECDQKEEKSSFIPWWNSKHLPLPTLPNNWTKMEEQIFCPRHKVKWEIENA